jgi:hypothetical protein
MQDKFIVLIYEIYLRGLEPEQRERIPRAKFFSFIFLADPKFTPIFPSIGREVSVPGEINSPLLPTCPIDIGNGPCDQQRQMRLLSMRVQLYRSSSLLLIYLESHIWGHVIACTMNVWLENYIFSTGGFFQSTRAYNLGNSWDRFYGYFASYLVARFKSRPFQGSL